MLGGVAYQYENVYRELRARIEAGEFAVGQRLPSIAQLMDEYDAESLGTIRRAQSMLAEDGLVRSEQGRGVFVVATAPQDRVDVDATLAETVALLERVRRSIRSQQSRSVVIDLDDERHQAVHYVLTEALTDFGRRAREAAHDSPGAGSWTEQAECAEWLIQLVEDAAADTDDDGARGTT